MHMHLPQNYSAHTVDEQTSPHVYQLTREQVAEYFPLGKRVFDEVSGFVEGLEFVFPHIPIVGLTDPIDFEDEGPISACPNLAPETICIVNMFTQDSNYDGIPEMTPNGVVSVNGLPPGVAYNYHNIARRMLQLNNQNYTPEQIDVLALQFNDKFFGPPRNSKGDYLSDEGRGAHFTLRIVQNRLVLDNPYEIGGQLGVDVSMLEDLLSSGREVVDQDEYNKYVESLVNSQKYGAILDKVGIPILIFVAALSTAAYRKHRKTQRAKMLADKKETGFTPGSAEDQLYRAIREELTEMGSRFVDTRHDLILKAMRDSGLKKSSWGIDFRIAAKEAIKTYGLFVPKKKSKQD